MRLRLGVALSSTVVIVVGLITLLGLLVGDGLGLFSDLVNNSPIRPLAVIFVEVAVVTVALTILIGFINLLAVHITRITRGTNIFSRLNSIALLVSFVGTIIIYVIEGANGTTNRLIVENVQIAGESALGALLFFALVWGAMQVLRREVSFVRVLFVMTIIVVLVSALPIDALAPLRTIGAWLYEVPVSAGGRGILVGIALATIVTGLRVLIGQDRSYGE